MSRHPAFLSDSQVVDYFLTNKTVQGVTPKTIEYYKANLLLFRKYLNTQEIPLLEVSQFDIMGFLAMRTKEVAPATLHIYWRVLRTFYNWCVVQEFVASNPMKLVPQPKVEHKVLPTFTETQINNMLAVCGFTEFLRARNYALLLVMLDTFVRCGELVAMQLDDIDWPNSTIKIHGKGRKERLVPFSVVTGLALKKYLLYHQREYPSVWLTEEGTPLSNRGVYQLYRRLKVRAGIADRRCSPHTMRHTGSCMYLMNEGDAKSLQDLLGHADMSSTEIYVNTVRMQKALSTHVQASPVANLKRSSITKSG